MEIRKLSNALGAEILDFRINADLSDETIADVRRAFLDHQILLFRDQPISHETHIAFSRRFGELDRHDSIPTLRDPQHHELVRVTNEGRKREHVFGQQWHSDHSMKVCPSMASLLHAHVLPDVGGDTMFASMYAAYDALSSGMKALLEPLDGVHDMLGARHLRTIDAAGRAERQKLNPPVVHPVVRVHPETGRKALYVNEMMTTRFEHMTEAESRPLLDYLFAHSTQAEFVYRHQWRKHDLIMWDNRCTMHLALLDYDHGQLRRLFRTTLVGDTEGRFAETFAEAA